MEPYKEMRQICFKTIDFQILSFSSPGLIFFRGEVRKEGIVATQSVWLRGRRAGEGTVEPSHHETREGCALLVGQ